MTSICEHVHVHVYSRTSNVVSAVHVPVWTNSESVSGVRFTKALGIHWPNNGSGNLHRKVICRYNVCVIHVNHMITKNGRWALTWRWTLTQTLR